MAAAAEGAPGPARELRGAWNTVSTGLVPPAALGLVRPRGFPGPRSLLEAAPTAVLAPSAAAPPLGSPRSLSSACPWPRPCP